MAHWNAPRTQRAAAALSLLDLAIVVLLHPLGLDAGCWEWLGLSEAILHEFPGHGSRPRLTHAFDMSDLADDLAEHIPDQASDVVGISLGGAVALHLALRYPARVRSLVVACTTAVEDQEALTQRSDETLASADTSRPTETTLQRWFTSDGLNRNGPPVVYARRRLMDNDRAAIAATWRALARHDVVEELPKIGCRTTLIAGLRDRSVPLSEMEHLKARLPTSRLVTIDGPHMLILENPAEFSAAIAEHQRWVEDS